MYRGSYIRTADGTVRPTLAGLLALGTYPQQFFHSYRLPSLIIVA